MDGFWLGVLGTMIGSCVTLLGQYLKHRWEISETRRQNENRKRLLRDMLDKPGVDGWRTMETLSGVIGANRDETARLLIEIGARASESGKDVWAYISKKPLP